MNVIFFLFVIFFSWNVFIPPVKAGDSCTIEDRNCVLGLIEETATAIEQKSWRDQTYRELAKTLAFEGRTDEAIALIDKIETPDTQAMTIRGIGMVIAGKDMPKAARDQVFTKLRVKADDITHPPSFAIALTYIAMAQAFAGDDEAAWATAAQMENDALRHKAYGETAEIQAERGDGTAAMKSISYIESTAYRNKSYALVAKILADQNKLEEALDSALQITNPYKKTKALQYILDIQKPRERLSGGTGK